MKYEISVYNSEGQLKHKPIKNSEAECLEFFNEIVERKNLEGATYKIEDVTNRENLKVIIEQQKAIGENRKKCCEDVLNFVTGHNINRNLSTEQINLMQEQYGSALMSLTTNRVDIAKQIIQAGEPDGVITTQELKDGCLQIFEQYGI